MNNEINPESIIPKLNLIGIEASIDYSTGNPVINTENADIEVIKAIASIEGWDLSLERTFGESASFTAFKLQSFNSLVEEASDDFEEEDNKEDESLSEEEEEALPDRYEDKSPSDELKVLTDAPQHKAALSWYNSLGNSNMAKYPSFLQGLDSFLYKYKNNEIKDEKEEASLTEEDPMGLIEIAKGKKKQSTRQLFLSNLMKIMSGDAGENIIRQWAEGRFDKFTGSMIKVSKMMAEHSPKAEQASEEEDSLPGNKETDNRDPILIAREYIQSLSPEEVTEFVAMCNNKDK